MTPKQWRDETIGKAFDCDNYPQQKYQCWDYIVHFEKVMGINVSAYCSLTGYVCDLWRLRDEYGYDRYFDYVLPGNTLQDGDWVIWDRGSSHPYSHVAMYYQGKELGQNQGYPYVTEKETTWDFLGAFRYKNWYDLPAGASDPEINGHKYHVYRQSKAETIAVISAGINKLASIKKLDVDAYVMAKLTGANFFQRRTDNPDGQAYGTTYGDISAPLNDVWQQLPNQDTTLYFDYDTGVYGDCTGITINAAHNVASPAVVYPKAGNYQYARMVGINHVNEVSIYSFVVRFTGGSYLLGIAESGLTPKQIAEDWRTFANLESIQFLDGGGSAQFGRWNGKAFEYVRDTGREVPSAVAIISNSPYEIENEQIQGETGEDEEQNMSENTTQETPENGEELQPEKQENWSDPEQSAGNTLLARIAALLSVKSIITLFLTVVFGMLVLEGKTLPDQFVSIYTMCISFFFGYQFKKADGGK